MTRSANDASVVIAEAIAGDEDEFAKLMTRKARALGMSRTIYRNANGLPNDEQVTTARDQATLGRAIQDRFPRYYRYFATNAFTYRGQSIRNHNHLLGSVEGVDGIKTGYTRASGFNLVTSMRRGNRHLVGVVLGGRSGGSRDATMRNLLAENLDKGATKRTVAAITERNSARPTSRWPKPPARRARPSRFRSTAPSPPPSPAWPRLQTTRSVAPAKPSLMAAAAAALPPRRNAEARTVQVRGAGQARTGAADQRRHSAQAISAIPGSAEPMKPVKVKTVQVKAGPMKLASAGPSQPVAPPITNAIAPARPEVAETSSAVVAQAERSPKPKPEAARPEAWPVPNCRRSRPITAPAMACSACCPPPACRPRPAQALAYCRSRRPSSRTAPSSPRPPSPTPAGSSRSARWKAKAKPARASIGAQPGPRPSRQGRSLHRAGRCQG